MGFSAVVAGGCNVGGFYSQFAALSASGIFMWIGLIIGVILALKYLGWEMEHIPSNVLSAGISLPPAPSVWKRFQPILGWILLILIFFMPLLYGNHTRHGVLATIALLAGFVMHRSRFCFVAAFRDPFMTGESHKTQGLILSVLIVVLGVGIIKWLGIIKWYRYIFPNAGWGGIIGGIIFGFGMTIAGGCGSGTLFRVGEGQLKLWMALVTMAISNSLTKSWLWPKVKAHTLSFGKAIYLPKSVGWPWAFIIIIAVMLIWYFFVLWNEESNKCVVI